MAQLLTKKETAAKARSMSADVAKALARLSSGLYVVTAGTDSTARGAMVASWVAQASFEPLGLSIAIAKDRAIESLMQVRATSRNHPLCHFAKGNSQDLKHAKRFSAMAFPLLQNSLRRAAFSGAQWTSNHVCVQVGDRFVLNCLGQKESGRIMKHFLQRFPPGADRFEGVESVTASNGCPALSEAIAFLECRVRSRMEVSDHWIVYAEVTKGNLTDADQRTAVHRRKVANYY